MYLGGGEDASHFHFGIVVFHHCVEIGNQQNHQHSAVNDKSSVIVENSFKWKIHTEVNQKEESNRKDDEISICDFVCNCHEETQNDSENDAEHNVILVEEVLFEFEFELSEVDRRKAKQFNDRNKTAENGKEGEGSAQNISLSVVGVGVGEVQSQRKGNVETVEKEQSHEEFLGHEVAHSPQEGEPVREEKEDRCEEEFGDHDEEHDIGVVDEGVGVGNGSHIGRNLFTEHFSWRVNPRVPH